MSTLDVVSKASAFATCKNLPASHALILLHLVHRSRRQNVSKISKEDHKEWSSLYRFFTRAFHVGVIFFSAFQYQVDGSSLKSSVSHSCPQLCTLD
ncbi:hypothetical protein Ae201684_008127 [Aphanomyces euteiches]|uniref:Uncharacterized protein n=1 Tax=Aphanomyces euteiches TaxID=100861 RepID=A0A6G0X638_9STRA|nr:hypothetical protein Ae201684_008127 [Aphanomyces euteiches]